MAPLSSDPAFPGMNQVSQKMLNWNNYQNELLGRVGEFAQLSPDTLVGYQALAGAGKKTGRLDEKTRELISLAVAVTTRCDGCIAIHTQGGQAGRRQQGRTPKRSVLPWR